MKQILFLLTNILPSFLFAQVYEPFDGPDITSLHPWQGDVKEFYINSRQQLQFISPARESGEANVSLPISYHSTMTWEMDVMLDFKSTNQNNLRIYVYHTDKKGDNTQYYIQVGNNTGQISFYSSKNERNTLRIAGRSYLLDEPYEFVYIRLTLTNNKEWALYTKKENESEYTMEGVFSQQLNDICESGVFSLNCRYIKGRISYYSFDNLRISPFIPDLPGISPPPPVGEEGSPELVDIILSEPSGLKLLFSEEVGIKEAVFEIEEIGKAIGVTHGETKKVVVVQFATELQKNKEYIISWYGLSDKKGHSIPGEEWRIVLEDDEDEDTEPSDPPDPPLLPAEPGSVIINEVMADPKGLIYLPETEYVELFNTTSESVSLKDWIFIYDTKSVVLENLILPSSAYVVLYKKGREIEINSSGIDMGLAAFPAALANNGKFLQLKDATGKVIDEISYPKAKPGVSWERVGDEFLLSTDEKGGTPGRVNSITGIEEEPDWDDPEIEPFDIIFNEFLPDPNAGGSEYIELYNRSGKKLSVKGLAVTVRKTDGTFSTLYPLTSIPGVVEPDSYLLLTKSVEGVLPYYSILNPENLYELKLPVLANTASTFVLLQISDQQIIDEVSYSSKWHSPVIKNVKGVALERISPDGDSQDPNNWTSASFDTNYGTPGYKNSQHMQNISEEDTPLGIESPVLQPDGSYKINYFLDHPGYSCRGYIYTLSGICVAEFINNELIGVTGVIHWNGNGYSGSRLNVGVHILFLEFYHSEGYKKQFKQPFLMK